MKASGDDGASGLGQDTDPGTEPLRGLHQQIRKDLARSLPEPPEAPAGIPPGLRSSGEPAADVENPRPRADPAELLIDPSGLPDREPIGTERWDSSSRDEMRRHSRKAHPS